MAKLGTLSIKTAETPADRRHRQKAEEVGRVHQKVFQDMAGRAHGSTGGVEQAFAGLLPDRAPTPARKAQHAPLDKRVTKIAPALSENAARLLDAMVKCQTYPGEVVEFTSIGAAALLDITPDQAKDAKNELAMRSLIVESTDTLAPTGYRIRL